MEVDKKIVEALNRFDLEMIVDLLSSPKHAGLLKQILDILLEGVPHKSETAVKITHNFTRFAMFSEKKYGESWKKKLDVVTKAVAALVKED
jgi:hypothetical protein